MSKQTQKRFGVGPRELSNGTMSYAKHGSFGTGVVEEKNLTQEQIDIRMAEAELKKVDEELLKLNKEAEQYRESYDELLFQYKFMLGKANVIKNRIKEINEKKSKLQKIVNKKNKGGTRRRRRIK